MNDSEKVIQRIKKAVETGIKAKSIAEKAGITYFRIYSKINPKAYTGSNKFTEKEIITINKALDDIKESI